MVYCSPLPNYVIMTHIHDEIRIIDDQKPKIFLLCNFVPSPFRLHSMFSRLNTAKV